MKVTFDELVPGWMTLRAETELEKEQLNAFISTMVKNTGLVRHIIPMLSGGPHPEHTSITLNPTGEPS